MVDVFEVKGGVAEVTFLPADLNLHQKEPFLLSVPHLPTLEPLSRFSG